MLTDTLNVTLAMPGALPKKTDSYLCSSFDARQWGGKGGNEGSKLPLYIQKFSVDSTAEKVHHLIVKARRATFEFGGLCLTVTWCRCHCRGVSRTPHHPYYLVE